MDRKKESSCGMGRSLQIEVVLVSEWDVRALIDTEWRNRAKFKVLIQRHERSLGLSFLTRNMDTYNK